MKSESLRTPLYSLSVESKAKFTDFAGWEMALQYEGLKKEHQAVRDEAGMFDISHMGKFYLRGKNLRSSLGYLVPTDLSTMTRGKALYSVLLNQQGGIIDDIIFYYQGSGDDGVESGILIVNASTCEKDWAWLNKHLTPKGVELLDKTQDLALIAIQGCKAESYLQSFLNVDLSHLQAFEHLTTSFEGQKVFVARTGYTGEDGFEVMTTATVAQDMWRSHLEQGVIPCGLGARDTLRLEAGMSLYGQEIDETTTPLEAGLGWLVNLNREDDFMGREILVKQKQEGLTKKLVGLQMEGRYIARHGYPIKHNNSTIGEVTSGTLSPTLNSAIALGYLPIQLSKIGQTVDIEIRGKLYPAKVVKKPFYRRK
ncbi:glycine cleavage system aminomethyltransferase GcvT [Cyanobacterium stanieri LEGE 03274]|uniref:Aminomethyltransferase n=1 Tax=Cyanobacterium stanieri LEGE 03274 TaxID=1828756 RepID=A0ABR9V3G0_9CHRO|nr:glycine cleavage system aminomethyltransferase GcvT [Cyanobacterium stanieri]MBE9222422.1 glycine cleavage system aminomethyltransferase GcvT [Cyanobacterium stanieri LEGE 03274]